MTLKQKLEAALGSRVVGTAPLPVGFGLTGLDVRLADGRRVAVKARENGGRTASLELEAYMLRELSRLSELPVPHVHYADASLLVMDYIAHDGAGITPSVERHAGELIAALHGVKRESFGYERDTLIGPLPQPNPRSESWLPFFRDHRLLHMAKAAQEEGALPSPLCKRIEKLAERIGEHLLEPAHPSLLHGDLWTGNVLTRGGKIAGFVDPAIYFGHPEIELAFATLFGTFGEDFFAAYGKRLTLEPGLPRGAARHLQPLSPACACQIVRVGLSRRHRCHVGEARPISGNRRQIATIRWAFPAYSLVFVGGVSRKSAQKRTGPDGAGPVFPAKRAELQRHGL